MVEALKAILQDVFRDLEKKQKNTHLEKARKKWEQLVGAPMAAHTRIIHLTKEKIHVNVDSSARLFSLNLKKDELKAALKRSLGTDELKLTLGKVTV